LRGGRVALYRFRSTLDLLECGYDLLHTGFQRLLVLSQTACPSGAGGCSLRGDLGHVLEVLGEYTTQIEVDGVMNDIHERDLEFMKKVYESAMFVADYLSWDQIECARDGKFKPIEEIHEDVYSLVKKKK
jgi:hypothetical protein